MILTLMSVMMMLGGAATEPATPSARSAVVLIGKAAAPGDVLDRSGLTNTIGSGIPHNRLGSWGSAIDALGNDLYLVADDRGPGDGSTAFRPRVHVMRIAIDPSPRGSIPPVALSIVETTLLTDEAGEAVWGYTGGYSNPPADPMRNVRLDPEGVRIAGAPTGGMQPFWLSEEYGPWLEYYDANGKRLARFAPPAKFMIAAPDGEAIRENELNNSGRVPNRGFEGLTVIRGEGAGGATTGREDRVIAMLQSPLIQDGGSDDRSRRRGRHVRMVEFRMRSMEAAPGKSAAPELIGTRELVYTLDDKDHGVNEILHVEGERLLVLERDGRGGSEARFRRIYLVDLAGATDVSAIESLPAKDLPEGVKPVSKRLLVDLLDSSLGLAGEQMPAKIEGLCWGPMVGGRRTLIVTTDNDFKAHEPSWVWVLGIEESALR